MKRLPKALIVGATTTLLLGLGACSSEPTPQEMTKTIIDTGWNESTAQERSDICMGIALFGKEGVATLMRGSVKEPGAVEVDWDYAADLLERKCNMR